MKNFLAAFFGKKHPPPVSRIRIEWDGDGILTFWIQGMLTMPDLRRMQSRLRLTLESAPGKDVRTLVILENFQGWKTKEDWGDIGFFVAHEKRIAQIAVVGDRQWEPRVFSFLGAGVRRAAMRFFDPDQLAGAREWLRTAEAPPPLGKGRG